MADNENKENKWERMMDEFDEKAPEVLERAKERMKDAVIGDADPKDDPFVMEEPRDYTETSDTAGSQEYKDPFDTTGAQGYKDPFDTTGSQGYKDPFDTAGSDPFSSSDSQKYGNPYGTQPQRTSSGQKKTGKGWGIASMVLGILALVLFCSCINLVLAVLAIIFGIIQIVGYEKKGMAIAGIVTAVLSLILWAICYGLLFSNAAFLDMVREEMQQEEPFPEIIEEYEYRYGIDGYDDIDTFDDYDGYDDIDSFDDYDGYDDIDSFDDYDDDNDIDSAPYDTLDKTGNSEYNLMEL